MTAARPRPFFTRYTVNDTAYKQTVRLGAKSGRLAINIGATNHDCTKMRARPSFCAHTRLSSARTPNHGVV